MVEIYLKKIVQLREFKIENLRTKTIPLNTRRIGVRDTACRGLRRPILSPSVCAHGCSPH